MFDPNAYFKDIAIKNKEINHNEEKPSFFREYSLINILFNNSDFLDNMRNAGRYALVSQFNEDGNYGGPNSDNKHRNYTGAIYIISRIIDKTKDQALKDTSSTLNDIVAKMEKDQEDGTVPLTFRSQDISIHSMGEIADGYYGVAAFMSYQEPACTIYNPDKWN